MSVPVNVSRLAALGFGFTAVCGASALVADPQIRTLFVWVGFVPFLWAIWPRGAGLARAGAGAPHRRSEPGWIPVEDFERVARQLEARGGQPAPRRDPPRPTAAGTSARQLPFPVQRRYNGMRRLTDQYLREVRRMNLVAVWGHEGSIPRRQALDQIREIEGRMRHLSEHMKFVAGRARN